MNPYAWQCPSAFSSSSSGGCNNIPKDVLRSRGRLESNDQHEEDEFRPVANRSSSRGPGRRQRLRLQCVLHAGNRKGYHHRDAFRYVLFLGKLVVDRICDRDKRDGDGHLLHDYLFSTVNWGRRLRISYSVGFQRAARERRDGQRDLF